MGVRRGAVAELTPQRAALIWKHEPGSEGSPDLIVIVVPFGTARFRVMQALLQRVLRDPSMVPRIGAIRSKTVVLRSAAALAWELMSGYRTVTDIAQDVARAGRLDPRETLDGLVDFCLRAHGMGLLNLDFPCPPAEGYAAMLLRDLDSEPLASAVADPVLRSALVREIEAYRKEVEDRA
ncbi:MAG: hypothetical protein K6T75_08025 [Acetobacteraceae bacterium]|nr:hypothetical protein [Acetobacteraceae bacterium]